MKNIFVFGADEFNLAQMRDLPEAKDYRFHALFQHWQTKPGEEIPVRALYQGAREKLEAFSGSVDAIVGYWDFPVSTMLALLREPYGLPSPSFEAILKCEHKYWSRLEQQRIVPEHIPGFCVIDPFAEHPRQQLRIDYPVWIKPVKSVSSHLGFKVRNDADFDHAIRLIRQGIQRYAKPFNYLLEFADLPAEMADIDGYHCIAEGIISQGRQCTLEGYVYRGEVCIYGAIDSIREGQHRSSFSRYQYPSTIPQRIQREMFKVTERFMRFIDFDNGPFNIEFYWDTGSDRISLLEINTRISKSHCPLFRNVDGVSHHKVMLDLALGQRPIFPHRQGEHRMAAKFMWRVTEDKMVVEVPDEAQLRELEARFPGAEIQLEVDEGMRLSQLQDQDSYSYEIAVIFLGGDSQKTLLHTYQAVRRAMNLRLEEPNQEVTAC